MFKILFIFFVSARFEKIWFEWQNKPLIYKVEKYGARLRTHSKILNYSSFFVPDVSKNLLFRNKKLAIKNFYKVGVGKYYLFDDLNYGESLDALEILKIPDVHKKGYFGDGVKIGILDTGYDLSNPCFSHLKIYAQYDFNSGDYILTKIGSKILEFPRPFSGQEVCYIQSFDGFEIGDTFWIYFSAQSDDSLSRGKYWRVYRTYKLPYGIAPNVEDLNIYGVNVKAGYYDGEKFVLWQTENGEIYIKFFPSNSEINLSNSYAFSNSPSYVVWRDTLFVFYLEEDSLFIFNFPKLERHFLKSNVFEYSAYIWKDSLFIGWVCKDSSGEIVKILDSYSYFVLDSFLNGLNVVVGGDSFLKWAYWDGESVYLNSVVGYRDSIKIDFLVDFAFLGDSLLVIDENFDFGGWGEGSFDKICVVDNEVFLRRRGNPDAQLEAYEQIGTGFYHGTKMLSIIGGYLPGQIVGVAPASDFILVKTEKVSTLGGDTFEVQIEEDFWVAGAEFCISKGADVISSSLGYSKWYSYSDMDGMTAITSRFASFASEKGHLIVTASGNEYPYVPLVAPADAFGVVAVGGVYEENDTIILWGYSGRGPTADGRIKPEVVAPYITWSCVSKDSFDWIGGTSVSTALVAGLCALIKQTHPEFDGQQIREILLNTSSLSSNPNDSMGWGVPDAYKAVFYNVEEKDFQKEKIIKVYPNPFYKSENNQINVIFFAKEPIICNVYIFSQSGKLVCKNTFDSVKPGYNTITIKLDDVKKKLSKGLYYLLIHLSDTKLKTKFAILD